MNDEHGHSRADARLNRGRILEVARQAFSDSPSASLNAIAKAAAVGPGTLYRHFPTREALVLAVYHKEIEDLVGLAQALAAAHPPEDAFCRWCARLEEYGRIKHGLADTLHVAITDRDYQATYWSMTSAVSQLLKAGQETGAFRSDVDPEDLLTMLGFLWRIKPGPGARAQLSRLTKMLLRSIQS